jgi:hypothetical protein
MFLSRPPEDLWEFSGDEEMNNTIGATLTTDQSRGSETQIARITCTDHGLKARSLIYLQGFANSIYNGIKRIDAVDTNTFDILLGVTPFAALTPAGSETAKPIVTYNEPWELVGFELSLDTAGGTTENFTVTVDAAKGAAWDTNLYTKDMNGVADVVQNWSQPRPLQANDLVIFGYANTDNRLWGLKVLTRRKS